MVTIKNSKGVPLMEEVEKFIDQLIVDKQLSGVDDEVRVQLKADLMQSLLDQIDRAAIDALPENKAEELSSKLDDENFSADDVTKFIQDSGVDMQQVSLVTMLRFRDLFLGAGE